MTQYFHVDESGDPGLNSSKSAPYFVVAMVQLPSREPLRTFLEIRKALHVAPTFEFHFHQKNTKQKTHFFHEVSAIPFRVRAAVLLKTKLPLEFKELHGIDVTINLITRLTLRASPLDIGNDILILDGAPESVRKELRIHITKEYKLLNRERPFKKIVSENSSRNDGLQLADMVAGGGVYRQDI
jgi:hypothetical protein